MIQVFAQCVHPYCFSSTRLFFHRPYQKNPVLLLGLLILLFACGTPEGQKAETAPIEVQFDSRVRFQTMEGWGGRFPDPRAGEPVAEIRREFVQELGLTRIGLELGTWNLLSLPEGIDPPQVDMSTFNYALIDQYASEVVLPIRQMVQARGERLVFYPIVV